MVSDAMRRRPFTEAENAYTLPHWAMPSPPPSPENPPAPRQLARDTQTGRVGEVMDRRYENGLVVQVWLRPVGGGVEWTADPEYVQRIPHDATCRCRGTGTLSRVVPLAGSVLISDHACPGRQP